MDLPAGTVLLDRDFGTSVVNATDVPNEDIFKAVEEQDRGLFTTFRNWAQQMEPVQAFQEMPTSERRRAGNLWSRDRYVTPMGFIEQMRLAQTAVREDDIVSGVAETSESLAFSSMSFFAEDPEEEDVYNQIARHIDLDSRMREIWRELFSVSQAYVAVTLKPQKFKVRGTTPDGNQRRKVFSLVAPDRVMLLDPTKVVPVGSPYGQAYAGTQSLAYIADRTETEAFASVLGNDGPVDPLVREIVLSKYEPDLREQAELSELGINSGNLWLLDPKKVFRHSLTIPAYRRVADVRMRSVYELLDMKHQLRQMERSHLIAGTNFIVLITKGTDQHPALPAEVTNLMAQVRTVSRVPILVGDHRLHVEIVTPKLDNTLRAERWNAIDSRITARLYGMFMLGNYAAGAGGDDSIKLVKVIARGMESRRHMIVRFMERYVFDPLYEGNEELKSRPKLQFHPRSIALDFDAAYASFLFDLRQANELSRETILNQFDLDQDLEVEYRKREEEEYDEVFQTQVPFSSPNPAAPGPNQPATQPVKQPAKKAVAQPGTGPRDNGGGRRKGGGAAPGTGQGQEPRRRAKRAAAKPAAAEQAELSISINGADGFTSEELIRALRAAFQPGENDDADEADQP
jgi:hypothetical protein